MAESLPDLVQKIVREAAEKARAHQAGWLEPDEVNRMLRTYCENREDHENRSIHVPFGHLMDGLGGAWDKKAPAHFPRGRNDPSANFDW